MRKGCIINTQHVYGEGNMVADAMAKRALGLQQGVFERWRTPLQVLSWFKIAVSVIELEGPETYRFRCIGLISTDT